MSNDAMKLALEALESCDAAHITDGGHQWYDEKLVDKAITALKALAEQPALCAPAADGVCESLDCPNHKPARQTACTWAQPDSDHMPDMWEAACGAAWTFTEGGPKDNGIHFCPKCGKPAIEAAHGIKENT